ncbi:MAG TPA: NHLP bacteriocin export ABC transporter permease/ATPase subunit [Bryobacteraceae bacterium]|nr:NHLP bacteriocin export ABC transporter permease/ATPase subunit [Bryobacteraceae bacterium]
MQTAIENDLALLGEVTELFANQSFLTSDRNSVWVVIEGSLDLFLQKTSENQCVGPRYHALRVEAGNAVFGADADDDRFVFVACPAQGTKIVNTSYQLLHAWLSDESKHSTAERLLDNWIIALSEAACNSAVPKKFVSLKPDDLLEFETSAVLAPVDGVLWAKHLTGTSRFVGAQNIPSLDGHFFPVSTKGWLQTQPGSSVQVISSYRWPKIDATGEGLQVFHRTVRACFVVKRDTAEASDRDRFRQKSEATASSLHRALCWFASAIDNRLAHIEEEVPGNALLSVCRAVGHAQQIQIVSQVGSRDSVAHRDPVAAIARASSVRCRQVVLSGKWWTRDGGPLVAFRDSDNLPVALLPKSRSRYRLYNPADRSSTDVTEAVAASLSGTAYCFYRPFPQRKFGLKELCNFGLASCRRDIMVVVLMGLVGGILNLAFPIGLGMMLDTAIPSAQRSLVVAIAAFLSVALVSSTLFVVTRNIAMLRLEGKLNASLQSAAWDRLLQLSVPFFRNYSSGDLAVRSLAFNEIAQILTGPVLSLIINQAFSFISVLLLFLYSWQLALLAVLLIGVAIVASVTSIYIYLQYARVLGSIRGRVSGTIVEFMAGVAKFRVASAEARAFAVWARLVGDRRITTAKARAAALFSTAFNSGWSIFCSAAIFGAASALMHGKQTLSTGSFLAFFAIFTQVVAGGLELGTSLFPILGIIPSYERLRPILEASPEVLTGKTSPGELSGSIEVSHLTFRYRADGPPVLNDISFDIGAGKMVALVGASGCGKSTMLRLLLGFEKPEAGAVYYDGQELAGLDLQAVRRQMGVVLQGARVGSGTLYSLIIGSLPLTIEDAWEAARLTGLAKDIEAMPMGMQTVIGEGGATLSGGQRQRLVIARAIVARPRILLFDEATSALDNETQSIVTASLDALRATRVVIAHRLSTIINADKILVLEKGKVTQAGTYKELLSQPGLFRELASRQIA